MSADTRATIAPTASSSNTTPSTTALTNPNTRCHNLAFRTPSCLPFQAVRPLGNVRSRRGATADDLLSHPRKHQGSRKIVDLPERDGAAPDRPRHRDGT